MNTNPSAKTILCFGDSNTWGADPETGKRFPADKRWTGVLQRGLGQDYYVIEEGLNGRTTMYTDPAKPLKNGRSFFEVCLHTHKPLHLVIIMLGTNDVKARYNVAVEDIGKGIEELVKIAQTFLYEDDDMTPPQVLIIAPPVIKQIAADEDEGMKDGPEKSRMFAKAYAEVAARLGCHFFDAGSVIESSDVDGYHLDESAHERLGVELVRVVGGIM